jgi:alkanesulfonate monooxygenase SsuD/methylene tetrahydromethanopterin reductase-like flavin-dependent oxidoreductase (luciferase family)
MFANTGPAASAQGALELARGAEAAGVESLWTVEHVVVPSGYQSAYPYARSGKMAGGVDDFDIPDPLVWLAYVAAATSTIKLATGILIVPQRNPLITAKEVATLDQLSGGRMILGVGVLSHLLDVMRAAAEEAGRDPAQIELTAGGGGRTVDEQLAHIDALHALGVHRVVVPPLPVDALAATVATVEERTS